MRLAAISSSESGSTRSCTDDYAESESDLTDVDVIFDPDNEEETLVSLYKDHRPEYFLQQLEDFDEEEYTKQDYSKSTTRLIDRMEGLWNQYVISLLLCSQLYCNAKKLTYHRYWTTEDRPEYLRDFGTVSLKTLNFFFNWLLSEREGNNGRKICGTKFASSLGTYWKVFRLVYERNTCQKINGKLNRSMHRVRTTSRFSEPELCMELTRREDVEKIGGRAWSEDDRSRQGLHVCGGPESRAGNEPEND
jgi:hypothetical protein